MVPGFVLEAFVEKGEERIPLRIEISEPAVSTEGSEYGCDVSCPYLFEGSKRIFGEDAAQAVELSRKFVRILLQDVRIVDSGGRRVRI